MRWHSYERIRRVSRQASRRAPSCGGTSFRFGLWVGVMCVLTTGCQSFGVNLALRPAHSDASPPPASLGTPVEQPPVGLFGGPLPAAEATASDASAPSLPSSSATTGVTAFATGTSSASGAATPDTPPQQSEATDGFVRLTARAVADVRGTSGGGGSGQSPARSDPSVRHVVHEQAVAAKSSEVPPSAIRFRPAEPRFPLDSALRAAAFHANATQHSGESAAPIGAGAPSESGTADAAGRYHDEYVWDGGDRDLPVHYDTFSRYGLETEDTVAEYSDDSGQRHVLPTNRVAIFAPRFGAVQTISGVGSGTQVAKLAYTRDRRRTSAVGARSVVDTKQQHETVVAARMRSRASGLEGSAGGRTVQQALSVVRHIKLLNAFQDVGLLKTGRVDQADQPRLAYGLQAALQWSRDQFPVISAQTASLHEVTAKFRPAEIVGRSLEHLKKGRLRIVKLADKKVAHPGDVITFTIRFDNLGDRPLYHVRIVDNLTPRLEYIDESARADRPGTLTIEDNEEGSVVLTFELDEPLAGHSGGVITFQTRLR